VQAVSEEAKKWILEHPEEAKKLFVSFYEWFGNLSYEMMKYISQLGTWLLDLYEEALKVDETGELKKRLEEAGYIVDSFGNITTMPKTEVV